MSLESEQATNAPTWGPYVKGRLDEIAALKDPTAPPAWLAYRAWVEVRQLLSSATATPSVARTEEGTIEFIWLEEDWDLTIEVLPDDIYVWARDRRQGEVVDGDLAGHRERVRQIVDELTPQ